MNSWAKKIKSLKKWKEWTQEMLIYFWVILYNYFVWKSLCYQVSVSLVMAFILLRSDLNMLSKCILKLVMIIIIFKFIKPKKCPIMVKTQTFRYSIISTILCSMWTGLPIPIYIIRLKLYAVSIQNMFKSMKAKMTVYRLKNSKRLNSTKSKPI